MGLLRDPMESAAVPAVVYPDGPAALGVCRALGAHAVPVTVIATSGSTPGQYSRHAHRVVTLSPAEEPSELVARLSRLGQEFHQKPVLFLADDPSLLALSRHRVALERWFRFPSASWPVLSELMLKDRLYESLAGVVPVPRTAVPADERELAAAAEAIGYPAIIKPFLRCLADSPVPAAMSFDRCFGAKAVRALTWVQLKDAYAAARARGFPVLVQEEIPGPISALYCLGVYVTRAGDVAATFTARKLGQVPADFGDGLIVQATRVPELLELGARALNHFGYHGIADLEFKWDARGGVFKLLDINPRPWLWIHFATACGVNLPYAAYLDSLDRLLAPGQFTQRDFETRWVSAAGLLTFTARALRAGRPDRLPAVLKHTWRARIGMLAAEDPLLGMYVSRAYWKDSLRRATAWLREVPREANPLPFLEAPGAAPVAGGIAPTRRTHDG